MSKAILLDTHVWLWFASGENLNTSTCETIQQATNKNEAFISTISIWEIGMLTAKNRIKLSQSCQQWIQAAIELTNINILPLSPEIAIESCYLPDNFHKDPADRIIIASARIQNLMLLTRDIKILQYAKQIHMATLKI